MSPRPTRLELDGGLNEETDSGTVVGARTVRLALADGAVLCRPRRRPGGADRGLLPGAGARTAAPADDEARGRHSAGSVADRPVAGRQPARDRHPVGLRELRLQD